MAKSPDAFRTISEVAEWLDTPAHVLRFWESKFSQVKPVKRAGGRRYYRPEDVSLLGGIKSLLRDEGMTIKGAQKLLRERGARYVASLGVGAVGEDTIEMVEATPEKEPDTTADVIEFGAPRSPEPEDEASLFDDLEEVSAPTEPGEPPVAQDADAQPLPDAPVAPVAAEPSPLDVPAPDPVSAAPPADWVPETADETGEHFLALLRSLDGTDLDALAPQIAAAADRLAALSDRMGPA